jgi:hypothetical protein
MTETSGVHDAASSLVSSDDALKKIKTPWWQRPLGKTGRYAALDDSQIATENERLKLGQRRMVAIVAAVMAICQVVCADVVFVVYAAIGVHWKLPVAAIQAWLAATVVQVIGLVVIITQSLFPRSKADAE